MQRASFSFPLAAALNARPHSRRAAIAGVLTAAGSSPRVSSPGVRVAGNISELVDDPGDADLIALGDAIAEASWRGSWLSLIGRLPRWR